jgi:hypothetical protein
MSHRASRRTTGNAAWQRLSPTHPKRKMDLQGLFSHLLELRTRLLKAVGTVLLVLVALVPFANRLYANWPSRWLRGCRRARI